MLCNFCRLKHFQEFAFQILLFYAFVEVYYTHLADEYLERKKIVTESIFKYGSVEVVATTNFNNNKITKVMDVLENLLEPIHILNQENIEGLKASHSVHNFKTSFKQFEPGNPIIQSSSGLIQTITMDLKPDRDTFLPSRTQQRNIDRGRSVANDESKFPNLSYSTLAIIHHDSLVASGDNEMDHFRAKSRIEDVHHQWHPDKRKLLASGNSQDGWNRIQLQQRIFSNTIGDKISTQYIL